MTNTMMTEQEAIAFCKEKLSELEEAIASNEKERSALQILLEKDEGKSKSSKKETKGDAQYLKRRERRVKKQTPSQEIPTATDLLKNPNLGVKGSLMQVLASDKKTKNSKELIEEIVNIEESAPYYKRVANSIRQSLRTAVKSGDIKAFRKGGLITYGVSK